MGGGGDAEVDGLRAGEGDKVGEVEVEGSTQSGSEGSWEDEVIAAVVAAVVWEGQVSV